MASDETGFDQTLIFTLPAQDARGRIVRLGPVLDTILSAHAYPPVVERLLAEALVLTALLGSTFKEPTSQLTLQAQTDNGAITLLVCDYLAGQLRGYVAFDPDRLAEAGADPSLFALFGKGFLGITFDHADTKQRYQGIVPLEGHCLADAAQTYFRQSEQLPTFARIAVRPIAGTGCIAGGVLVQQLAFTETEQERLDVRAEHRDDESRWDHVRALAETLRDEELTSATLSLEAVVWRLFHDEDEVRVTRGDILSRGCRCDPAYLATVIARFPADERAEMAGDNGMIGVDCAFCSRTFAIDPEQ
ncbi:MAG: Hsp33 family molecular chaperone HslO [Sphingopyxis sp.]